ncbi:MAG TPA: GDSL-type esterase/lipase family protein [Tepidisphaeraceae bacterium]|jgi:lysophospholipase L1-like esterase|nr:GDSL-type esterase/lipase family protein [Tepidisphaeraceae bacterium]
MSTFRLKNLLPALIGLLAVSFVAASTARADDILVKSGEKLAFLGDSITAAGAGAGGYCRLVIAGLDANGVKVEPIFAGISGHKSNDMLARVDKDVIAKKPDWMTLSCGVNDVWHGKNGVPLEDYKKNITAICDKCDAAKIKVMILTSTMIHEDQPNANNQKLIGYNDFLRELAKERKYPLADLNADMQAELKAAPEHKGNYLTVDGVHMNALGNKMMASGILKAFGLNEEQMKKAKEAWEGGAGSKK